MTFSFSTSEKSRLRVVGPGATHTRILLHSTPHAHTAHRAAVASIDSHRGRGEGRQRHAAEGSQGADATSMAPPCALSTATAAHADAGALRAAFFLLQNTW